MTRLNILSSHEQRQFDSPPILNSSSRSLYFALDNNMTQFVETLRSVNNQVGFVLQLGYFRANGKFFAPPQYRMQDIEYICKMFKINLSIIDILAYQDKTIRAHRKKILALLHFQPLSARSSHDKIKTHILWLIPKQLSPKRVFLSSIDFCWHNKIELPSYHLLSVFITDIFNNFEDDLIKIIDQKLTDEQRIKLDDILGVDNTQGQSSKQQMSRPPITLIKNINQSLLPYDIQQTVCDANIFKEYFYVFKSIIEALNLPSEMTEYFAIWVQKSTATQLTSFVSKSKTYLHLLCYIKHQFYFRQDTLIDIFLKSTQTAVNVSHRETDNLEKQTRFERNKAIKKLSSSHKNSRELLERITAIVKSQTVDASDKVLQIEKLVDAYNTLNATSAQQLIQFEESLDKIGKNQLSFDSLESSSLKLQRRVSTIVKNIDFDSSTSSEDIMLAIDYFKSHDGLLGHDAPRDFLSTEENAICFTDEKLRISLYKVLLFMHIASAIKSGKLNLLYSYRYLAIQRYLIDDKAWKVERTSLLTSAGLDKFADFSANIRILKEQLGDKYKIANERFINNENSFLTIDDKLHLNIATPKTESSKDEYIAHLLSHAGYVPILKILSDVDHYTQFTKSFKHHSIKHTKMKPSPAMIFAGIIGKGCNIGVNRLANISVGISEDMLKNSVNWHFSMKNIQSANNKIIKMIDKLLLTTAFRHDKDMLHTSSDGRKVSVAVDSLMTSYSYKYFGRGKGVTMYLFIDERHILFYSTIISSSEREAAYVIDGLLQNEVIKSQIHSTDTHGFTEIIFAITHFLDIAFAPRLKNIGEQRIYSFVDKKTYEKRGYKILPSRTINIKLIEDNWDDILRFMATIKLKYTTASQLLKRLSSYARDHPLYKALKEFGRIPKSIFIPSYLDDVTLRQTVEKQLNKIESSNKFSKAVFFANNQEFQEGTKEEQETTTACKVLIQNAIVLWNYLYLSQLIVNNENEEEQKIMFQSMAKGSVVSWGHVNFQGEYDFTKHVTVDENIFDINKILALKINEK